MADTTSTTDRALFETAYTIRADRERVWEALTSAETLRTWFAEHAEVDLRVGGRYRFWGRYTPTFGYSSSADQTITALTPGRSLSFDWHWAGDRTAVNFELTDAGDSTTILRVRHAFTRTLADFDATETCWIAKDFWRLVGWNLEAYCRTGAAALRPDHSGGGGDVQLSIRIDAPPAAVWRQLIDPACVAAWLGDDSGLTTSVAIEPRVGGAYSYGWEHDGEPMGPSEVLEIEPERRLVVRWRDLKGTTDTTVWEIEPAGDDACVLTVRQLNTGSAKEASGYINGWAGFMLELRSRVGAG